MHVRSRMSLFILVLTASQIHAGEVIAFNDNGGWCWYQDERVIVHDGKLIIGSVANRSGTDGQNRHGNIEVSVYDIEAGGRGGFFPHFLEQGKDKGQDSRGTR